MKTEIDFQSTNRFFMSIGFALCIISIIPASLLLYGSDSILNSIILFALVILFLFMGLLLLHKGYNGLKEFEDLEKKTKFEYMVNQILDQDLKLIDIKIKQLEYNGQVRILKETDKSTPLGIKTLKEVQYRDIPNVVAQALNPNFYEKTYPNLVKSSTEKIKTLNIQDKKEPSGKVEMNQETQLSFPIFIAIISIGVGFFGSVLANYSFARWQSFSPKWGYIVALIGFGLTLFLLVYSARFSTKKFKF